MKSVGVLGAGSIADVYIRNAPLMRNYRVVAVAAPDAARTAARAAEWGLEAETPDRLIARDDIDIVLNLTPAAAHYATTMAALEAGKHVFCEKTLGTTLPRRALWRMRPNGVASGSVSHRIRSSAPVSRKRAA